jgi:HEAT repeat protein
MLWWTLQQLKSANPKARAKAARQLGATGNRKAVPGLIRALTDEDPSVRIDVAGALGALAHPAAVEPLAKSLAGLARAARNRRGGADRSFELAEYEALSTALGKFGPAALTSLVRLLGSEDGETRRWTAHALGLIKDPQAIPALAERLGDNRSEVRRAVATALGEIGDAAAFSPLQKALTSRDPETRRAVVQAIGAIGGNSAAEALLPAIEDENDSVQLAAVEALRRIGGLRSAQGLRRALEVVRKRAVNEAATAALSSMTLNPTSAEERALVAAIRGDFAAAADEGPAAIPAVLEALDSRDPHRRLRAAEALATLRTERAIQPLLGAFKDYDSAVREMAANALADIGEPALEELRASLQSPDATVQRLAAHALGRIASPSAAADLTDTIYRNRRATSTYPEQLEATRAAAEALGTILSASAAELEYQDLERIAAVPDGLLEHPEGENQDSLRPERIVDCTRIREMARKELDRRAR